MPQELSEHEKTLSIVSIEISEREQIIIELKYKGLVIGHRILTVTQTELSDFEINSITFSAEMIKSEKLKILNEKHQALCNWDKMEIELEKEED